MKRKLTLLLSFILSISMVKAQEWELGGWIGVANYFGDLNTNTSFEYVGPSGGIMGRYNFGPRLAAKTGFNFGVVSYDDIASNHPYQKARNLSFRTSIFEWSTHGEFNFFKYLKDKERFSFTPYLLAGVSLFIFNPRGNYEGQWIPLQPLRTENERYSRFSVAIPFGGGFKYSFARNWTIQLEIANRRTFTDYLDDVSTVYEDNQVINNQSGPVAAALADRSGDVGEPIGTAGKQRGNWRRKDDFVMIGLGFTYCWFSVKCPKPKTVF